MTDVTVSKIFPSDKLNQAKVTQLLEDAGIKRDRNLDYTCGIFEDDGNLIATGSLFTNSLRCFAICKRYSGEALLNTLITHLITVQFERGNSHLFVYTKPDTSKFFKDLGFYPIAEIPQLVTFMENRKSGFAHYLKNLQKEGLNPTKSAAIVMNANPFTLGHLYLVEKAAAENELLHLFMVSEDSSLIPFSVRKELIKKATAHLDNLIYHETGPYLIGQASFPSYFQEDEESVILSQAQLDANIFSQIAKTLQISRRYLGDEPNSLVTNHYNAVLAEYLPEHGIECLIIPRKHHKGKLISASTVRQYIKEGNLEAIQDLVPQSTYDFLTSEAAKDIINHIQSQDNVIHY
ncbi:[citrate (pro-3S)-lyase] ligase [Streptococcus didelphis]|uniref:[Citrate [pro-3S]-lyase] ligase n=1 Tax=Streptococcus didelphis TaxID=102886 RepID=A0ABY9LGA3_9STRE|nr:[citrate (pro-3S)-lyase] ligase [Streptococcus didelphis]WMB27935.1 [citrate (pro-3S)-lyase] ligase [Streptococcus didelphis]WMB29597.1 [citrate (pro-3S)-lyase] ligase [Streptococcus didelphis]